MSKELIFMSCQPDDLLFSWQTETFIENIRRLGYDNEIRILLFVPHDRLMSSGKNIRYQNLEERYKNQNVKFFWYEDHENFLYQMHLYNYVPLLRPHILEKHFREYPELKEKAIFYHDSDIVFTQKWDINKFKDDDINYLSDTRSYINSEYFDSKSKDVKEEMKDAYQTVDVLALCTKFVGITREICEKNKENSGGAQYLLKNIDADFWRDVKESCMKIRNFLLKVINPRFFNSENEGFQSWCADMWAVLWNLWKREQQTLTPIEMDFAWATDGKEKWSRVNIYHDAGVGGDNTKYLFDKRDWKYVNNLTIPFYEDNSHVSNDYCSRKYVEELDYVKNKYYNPVYVSGIDPHKK